MINEEKAGKKYKREEILKHRNDVCRLSALLSPKQKFILPQKLINDLNEFIVLLSDEKPEIESFMKLMGIPRYTINDVINQLQLCFAE